MAIVKTPVEGFTGKVVGVNFLDGVGESTDPLALAYFARQGYTIEPGPSSDEGAPSKSWTKKEIVAFLTERGIEASEKEKVDELLEKVPAAE